MWWLRFTGGSVMSTVKRCTGAAELHNSKHAIRAEREHAKLDPLYQQIRAEEKLRLGTGKKQSKHTMLTRAIWRCYKSEFIQAALLKLGWSIFIVTAIAFFIRQILLYLELRQKDDDHTWDEQLNGILLCIFFTVCVYIFTVFLQQMNWVSARLGLKVQSAITTQIYIKSLRRAEGTGSKADIVAMVAKDVSKIADACAQVQFLWSGIFEAIVIFAVLIAFIGYNALPGLLVFVIMLPLQYMLGLWIARKKATISVLYSERAQLTEEILRAMKLIKMYAWETSFSEKVTAIRNEELQHYKWQTMGKTVLIASVFMMPPLFVAAIFGIYAINNEVGGTIAFTTLTLFNTLRLPLVKLPKALRDCTDALHAIEKIDRYLQEPEVDDSMIDTNQAVAPGIRMESASFSHGFASPIPFLTNINLDINPGTLTMVAGSVGAGKSSLLKAILGQLHLTTGSSQVGGTYAYVPQSPWCALGTVRDNILFGKAYEKVFYDKVCKACSLERDFELFKDGDMTWIGERGGNLSGGQKQRIALARACYSQNDIIVLDSPLSAVDMHTCQHIFKHCIQELMLGNGRTVVLSTHQVELLCNADHLIVMEDAKFKYSAPYNAQAVQKLFPNAALGDAVPGAHGKGNKIRNPAITQNLIMSGSDAPVGQFPQPAAPGKGKGLDIVVEQPVVRAPIVIDPDSQGGGFVELFKNWTPLLAIPLYLLVLPVAHGARTFSDIWFSQWTQKTNTWGPQILSQYEYYAVYIAFITMFFFLQILRGVWFFKMGLGATRKCHSNSFNAVMRAPMAFFNLTPIGKTLNFFSRDIDVMDDALHDNLFMVSIYFWLLAWTFYVLINRVPIYAIIIGGCFVIFLGFFHYYLKASKSIKLVLGAASANAVSHTAETLTGLAVVRAFRKEAQFLRTNMMMQDDVYRAGAELNNCNHWIAIRVDMLGTILCAATVFLAVLYGGAGAITNSAAGLMVSNCIQIILFFTASVTLFGEITPQATSVERSLKLKRIEPERDLPEDDKNAVTLPEGWPSQGGVVFDNVHMSYMPGLPPVLKGCSFRFEPGQKIGVVGRTGAGKSTLIMSMFRLAETSEGTIHIDGIKNDAILLQQLRSRIAIIPQEPIMFKGTVRTNLDPFGRYTDSQLVDAMERCLLTSLIDYHSKDFGLSAHVDVFGSNYSLGQQQLICLARALLTPSKLLLLDEATAALDSDTDAAVQKVLRENFKDRTIMTIAHRLDTIIDSDKILSMDAGKVGEFDSPQALLANPKSIFSELCKNAGEHEYNRLLQAAGNKAGRTAASITRPPIRPMMPGKGRMAPHGMPRFTSPTPPRHPSVAPHHMISPMMSRGGSPPMMIPLGMPYPHRITFSPSPMSRPSLSGPPPGQYARYPQ